jgi:hypothetical protein
MPNLTEHGKALLLRVADEIIAHADHFDMSTFVGATCLRSLPNPPEKAFGEPNAEICGTTCCIAGWALTLDGGLDPTHLPEVPILAATDPDGSLYASGTEVSYLYSKLLFGDWGSGWAKEAKRLLFHPDADPNLKRLMYADEWPQPYRDQYARYGPDRPVAKAEVAASLIRAVVESDGDVLLYDGGDVDYADSDSLWDENESEDVEDDADDE